MILVALFLLVSLFLYWWKDTRKPDNFPPGPKWLPFIGTLLLLKKLHKTLGFYHLVWYYLSRKYGSIVGLRIGRDRLIIVDGKEAIKEFYNLPQFNGRPDGFFYRIRSFNKRLGIVFCDGNFWEIQRKFSSKILRHLGMGKSSMIDHIEQEAMEMVKFFNSKCKNDHFIEMQHVFDVPVLNTLWALLAGSRFSLDDERLPTILAMIHESFRVIDMSGGVLNQFPIVRIIAPDLSGYRPLLRTLDPLWTFIKDTINDKKNTLSRRGEPNSFIEAFLLEIENKADRMGSYTFTDDQLLAICLDLFQAGTETTSNSLTFGIIYMLHNDTVQTKLRTELDSVVGRSRLPNNNDRCMLPYTEAVVCEIQRLANVAPLGIAHRCTQTVKFGGYTIPKNTIALVSLYSVHMDEGYWKDPFAFRPERFLDEHGHFIYHENFLPFGLGKRRCMGEHLAKSSLFLFFASFMHSFNIQVPAGYDLPDTTGLDGITLSPKPFKLVLSPRF